VVYEHFQAGMELLENGNPAQAAVRLEKARSAQPGKASVREALGRAYFDLGRLHEAEREFRSVVEIDPTNDYAHYCLSRVLQRRGRFKQAEAHLKLARAMSPDERRYRRWSGD
jgi:Flp pilus assembly protein TadD